MNGPVTFSGSAETAAGFLDSALIASHHKSELVCIGVSCVTSIARQVNSTGSETSDATNRSLPTGLRYIHSLYVHTSYR